MFQIFCIFTPVCLGKTPNPFGRAYFSHGFFNDRIENEVEKNEHIEFSLLMEHKIDLK